MLTNIVLWVDLIVYEIFSSLLEFNYADGHGDFVINILRRSERGDRAFAHFFDISFVLWGRSISGKKIVFVNTE